jgi:hypothetical protein
MGLPWYSILRSNNLVYVPIPTARTYGIQRDYGFMVSSREVGLNSTLGIAD